MAPLRAPSRVSLLVAQTELGELDRLLEQAEGAVAGLDRAAAAPNAPAEQRLLEALEALRQRLDSLASRGAALREALAAGMGDNTSRASQVRAILKTVEAMEAPSPDLVGRCRELCTAIDAELDQLGEGEAEATNVRDVAWTAAADREVRVEVLSASDLAPPAYRFGDLTSGYLGGAKASSVYVEARVGQRTCKTETACVSPERRVDFSSERLLFSYSSESVLSVAVRDKRGLQAVVRGDPLIGEGQLPLRDLPWDPLPQLREIPLKRGGKDAGVVSLRFQMLSLSGGLVVAPNAASLVALPVGSRTYSNAPARDPVKSEDFVTPPSSPREAI